MKMADCRETERQDYCSLAVYREQNPVSEPWISLRFIFRLNFTEALRSGFSCFTLFCCLAFSQIGQPLLGALNGIAPDGKTPDSLRPRPAQSAVKVVGIPECSTLSLGSGVVIEPGVVVTNAHVVQGAQEVTVQKDGRSFRVSAHILVPELDLCLLKVPGLPFPPALLAGAEIPEIGVPVRAVGFPGGMGPSDFAGTITGHWRIRNSILFQANATTRPGSSGGGLFTEEGRLLGITTFGILADQGFNFSVPATWIPELLSRPWREGIGVQGCRSREMVVQEFLEKMTEDASNRVPWEAFSRAWVAARPSDPEAWFSLGQVLFQRSRDLEEGGETNTTIPEAAISAYKKGLELNPSFPQAWNNLGVLHDNLDQSQQALSAFRMAVNLKGGYALAWINLGGVLIGLRQWEDGVHALERAVSIVPDDARAWARLAFCEMRIGRMKQAADHLRVALRHRPTSLEWWMDLAEVYRKVDDRKSLQKDLAFIEARLPALADSLGKALGTKK